MKKMSVSIFLLFYSLLFAIFLREEIKVKNNIMLYVLVAIVGIFSYFSAFKGVVYIWMIPLMLFFLLLWYITTILITEKMVRKTRRDESFFFLRAGLISADETKLDSGALVVTSNELVFYVRKGLFGGIKVLWSCFVNQIESYSMGMVDERHYGIKVKLKGEEKEIKIASSALKKKSGEFEKALGWS